MTSLSDGVRQAGSDGVSAPLQAASIACIAARPALGVAAGILLSVALRATGAIAGSNGALEEMGFDADRAKLITGLTVGGLAAGPGALLTGRRAGG